MQYDAQESRARIGGSSVSVENAIQRIIDEHIGDLNDVVDRIRVMLKDDTDILTDQEIEDILLQLPLLLYDVSDNQEVVGMQSDLAGLIYKESYNEALKIARGTVQEKTSASELATMTEKLDTIIYDRAYKIIKQKISMAIEVLNAVKRIQATRVQGVELGNKTNF